ncbi:MAG: hypothetical protein R3C53_11480 [Pirellulaceae bacterium]
MTRSPRIATSEDVIDYPPVGDHHEVVNVDGCEGRQKVPAAIAACALEQRSRILFVYLKIADRWKLFDSRDNLAALSGGLSVSPSIRLPLGSLDDNYAELGDDLWEIYRSDVKLEAVKMMVSYKSHFYADKCDRWHSSCWAITC